MNGIIRIGSRFPSQRGAGMLTIVATLGIILVLVQGTVYYKAKGGAHFLDAEKNKVLALQLAEAGVEENIADLGKRTVRVRSGMIDTVTYDNHSLGGGAFTTRISTLGTGAASDTVELLSTGTLGRNNQSVRAKLKLKNFMDTSRTPIVIVKPETTLTLVSHSAADTDTAVTVLDPNSLPPVDKTPAYAACMASSAKKCTICHIPPGNFAARHVQNVDKHSFAPHLGDHGDYVTTDNSCDLYKPKLVFTVSYHSITDTTRSVINHTTYDTTVTIDTLVKIQILSWK